MMRYQLFRLDDEISAAEPMGDRAVWHLEPTQVTLSMETAV